MSSVVDYNYLCRVSLTFVQNFQPLAAYLRTINDDHFFLLKAMLEYVLRVIIVRKVTLYHLELVQWEHLITLPIVQM